MGQDTKDNTQGGMFGSIPFGGAAFTAPVSGAMFVKHDHAKLRWSLLPLKAAEATVEVLEIGAQKYSDDNWRNCPDSVRYWDAALRHLMSWKMGEKHDEESGKNALAHAAASILFLLELELEKNSE